MADIAADRQGWTPPSIPTETLADRFRFIRLVLDMKVTEIAAYCGVNKATWRSWEDGTVPQRLHEVVAKVVAATHEAFAPDVPIDEVRDWLIWGPMSRCFTVSPGQGSFWPSLVAA